MNLISNQGSRGAKWAKLTIVPQGDDAQFAPAGCIFEDAGLVDGQHLVFIFRADFDSHILLSLQLQRTTGHLTKYVECESRAPCLAPALKLATLGHYRSRYPDLEGVGDVMEGRVNLKENFAEFRQRTGAGSFILGEHYVKVETTYEIDDAALIYCTAELGARPEKHWTVACPIRCTLALARQIGIECARQSNQIWRKGSGGMDIVTSALLNISQLQNTINVYHGPVVYRDDPGRWLWHSFGSDDKGRAIQFLKDAKFAYQKEYRFVVSSPGYRPVDEAVLVRNTRDLKGVFEQCVHLRAAP